MHRSKEQGRFLAVGAMFGAPCATAGKQQFHVIRDMCNHVHHEQKSGRHCVRFNIVAWQKHIRSLISRCMSFRCAADPFWHFSNGCLAFSHNCSHGSADNTHHGQWQNQKICNEIVCSCAMFPGTPWLPCSRNRQNSTSSRQNSAVTQLNLVIQAWVNDATMFFSGQWYDNRF